MRKTLLAVLTLAVVLAFTGVVSAAEQAAPPPQKPAKEIKADPYKDLNLTKDQKQKIRTIRQQAKADMEKAAGPEEKAKIRKATNDKIVKEVLTETQREQLAASAKPEPKHQGTLEHGDKHKAPASQPHHAKRD